MFIPVPDSLIIHVYQDESTSDLSLWTLVFENWICVYGCHLGLYCEPGTPEEDLGISHVGYL